MFEEIINNKIDTVNSYVLSCEELILPLISKEFPISKILEIDTNKFLEYFVEKYNTSAKPKVYLIPLKSKWGNLHSIFEFAGRKQPTIVDECSFEILNEKNLPIRYVHFSAKYIVKHETYGSIYTINPNVSKFVITANNLIDE